MTRRLPLFLLLLIAVLVGPSQAGSLGFREDFVLAANRAKTLEQLIPGTNDYYFYHCLHYLQTGQFDRLDEVLHNWQARKDVDRQRLEEIRIRRILQLYPRDNRKMLDALRNGHVSVSLHHSRRSRRPGADLPTRLDQDLISRKAFARHVLRGRNYSLEAFGLRAMNWLPDVVTFNDVIRRNFLRRLDRPDYPDLVDLILTDLHASGSGNFGYLPIHSRLTLAQLDELVKKAPALRNNGTFVIAYAARLRPADGIDREQDKQLEYEYHLRLWKFASTLGPAHNSFKANVLYHLLVHRRSMGAYEWQLFKEYLKLPRRMIYVDDAYLRKTESRSHMVDLSADYSRSTRLAPVGNDQELVKSYFMEIFGKEEDWKEYSPYVKTSWLKRWFAEAKILSGQGDPEKWASLLTPAEYQQLKGRTDIDFAYTRRETFGPDQDVSLTMHLKNVGNLLVKIYRINTRNYYRLQGQPIGTDIQLDGLVPNARKKLDLTDVSPFVRITRTLEFPEIRHRGVYVVDLIGNGKASRALIRVGSLHYLQTLDPTGQAAVLSVLDEGNSLVADAAVTLGNHRYLAGEDGYIRVPLSTQPGRKRIILEAGDFADLDWFEHPGADYSLQCGFHVEQEDLLTRSEAEVILHPRLLLNRQPLLFKRLTDVRLEIQTRDLDGVHATKTVSDLKPNLDEDLVASFGVPPRLEWIRFTLRGKIRRPTTSRQVDLSATRTFGLNGIDTTAQTHDVHLVRLKRGWALDVLGKTGEPLSQVQVAVDFHHADVADSIQRHFQTDQAGRVHLGAMEEIGRIVARCSGVTRSWDLKADRYAYDSLRHAQAGQAIRIAYMGGHDKPLRQELSLLEMRSGQFYADRFDALSIRDGFIEIAGLDQGNYVLWIKSAGQHVSLRVEKGRVISRRLGNYVLGQGRNLQLPDVEPMQIVSVSPGRENVRIQLANPSDFAVVHVTAVRFMPAFDLYGDLMVSRMPLPEMVAPGRATSAFVTGRDIGDEYRYVLNRKDLRIFPGNMLDRPGLILNPWALRQTQTGVLRAQGGENFRRMSESDRGARGRGPSAEEDPSGQAGIFSNLNFLAGQAVVLTNLVPDENGRIEIPRNVLGDKHHLHVVAADPFHYVYRSLVLPEPDASYRDLRLRDNLDPSEHLIHKRKIEALQAGESLQIGDIKTARVEIYDSLPTLYAQYLSLVDDPKLRDFAFLMNWPELTPEQKREKYSSHACHELHFFLSHKDPEFFKEVIKPYLANKKDKTFLDHYLIEDAQALRAYLQPWAYAQLNVAERVLLGKALPGQVPHTREHLRDLLGTLEPGALQWERYFRAGLGGRGLSSARDELSPSSDGIVFGPAEPPPTAPARPSLENAVESIISKEQEELKDKAGKMRRSRRKKPGGDRRPNSRFSGWDVKRTGAPSLYRRLEKTTEWAENNYYKLRIEDQNASLIDINEFWKDYADHQGQGAFLSRHFSQASGNAAEALLALAVTDLPFQADEHKVKSENDTRLIEAASPAIVFHQQIQPVEKPDADKTPILISQNFFRADDRYRRENNQRVDKFVTEEFLIQVVYGGQVVVTNPTSSSHSLDVLVQIPAGAMPVNAGHYTDTVSVTLQPYSTHRLEYFFYFPAPGDFQHYPVHVSREQVLLASAEAFAFHVVAEPSKVDTQSWAYVSQYGSKEEVIEFLENHNPLQLSLGQIAWRMKEESFFQRTLEMLSKRHVYDHTLWGYGFMHNDAGAVQEYLKHAANFVSKLGPYVRSPLLRIDPVVRRSYQHLEYWPLVNARRHRLGPDRRIPNQRIYEQYTSLLEILKRKTQLEPEDQMAVVYYLLLQDRVAEAIERFAKIDPEALDTRLQYDCFQVYIAFYTEELEKARRIVRRYEDYPVPRWRKIFANAAAQLDQIEGKQVALVDPEDRRQQQTRQVARQPAVELKVENRQVTLNYQNVTQAKVNYYLMDIELLFSRSPFVKGTSKQFSYVEPNFTQTVPLDAEARTHTFDLPDRFHSANVLVEVEAGPVTASKTYFANSMRVQVIESYGQLQVTSARTGKGLSKVYVKVYARTPGGEKFFKDGYTDLRGRFDYTSLSSDEIKGVSRFAILVLSKQHGALIREAAPPQR